MTDVATTDSRLARRKFPARSKMLDMYAGDVAWLLASGRIDAAEKLALAIPHFGVALADESLHSSREAYERWCTQWIEASFAPQAFAEWCTRSGECVDGPAVPFAALQGLRLRRRAREVPPPSLPATPAADCEADLVSRALLRALQRWYELEGRAQDVVQINLARLGVLR